MTFDNSNISPIDPKLILNDGIFSKDSLGITARELNRVYSQAKQLYDAGKFEEARTLFSALIILDSQVPAFLYGLASTFLMLKEYDGAIEAFLEYAGLVQNDPLPYFFVAECYEKKNDIVSTMIALQTVINRAGDQTHYQEIKNRASLVLNALKIAMKEGDKVSR